MSQEETKENLNPEEIVTDLSEQQNTQQIDNLPIEAIGSYARVEESLIDEESDDTSNSTSN